SVRLEVHFGIAHQVPDLGTEVEAVPIDGEGKPFYVHGGVLDDSRGIVHFHIDEHIVHRFGEIGVFKGGIVRIDLDVEGGDMVLVHDSLELAGHLKVPAGLHRFDVLGIGLGDQGQKVSEIRGRGLKGDVHLLVVLIELYISVEYQGQLVHQGPVLQETVSVLDQVDPDQGVQGDFVPIQIEGA